MPAEGFVVTPRDHTLPSLGGQVQKGRESVLRGPERRSGWGRHLRLEDALGTGTGASGANRQPVTQTRCVRA